MVITININTWLLNIYKSPFNFSQTLKEWIHNVIMVKNLEVKIWINGALIMGLKYYSQEKEH